MPELPTEAIRASRQDPTDWRALAEQLYEGLKQADETIRQVGVAVGKASEETRVRTGKSIRDYNPALFAYEAALAVPSSDRGGEEG